MTRSRLRALLPATLLAAMLVAFGGLFVAACGGASQTSSSDSASSVAPAASATPAASEGEVTSGSIVFSGLIDYPMTFTALDMDYMDWVTMTADHPGLGSAVYEGVSLSDILSYVGVQAEAVTMVVMAADGSTAQVTIADIPADALLALANDDSLSTVMPGMAAEAWVEDVVAMEFK
jgi:hypothetical protein